MGIPLVVQWLGLRASTAGGTGSIPGGGTKILQATRCSLNKLINLSKKEEVHMIISLSLFRQTVAAY